MICPFCNKEMKKGYLQSPGIIIWGPRKKRLLFTAYNEDEFYVNGDKLFDDSVDSYYCPTCKKIIVEVDDNDGKNDAF